MTRLTSGQGFIVAAVVLVFAGLASVTAASAAEEQASGGGVQGQAALILPLAPPEARPEAAPVQAAAGLPSLDLPKSPSKPPPIDLEALLAHTDAMAGAGGATDQPPAEDLIDVPGQGSPAGSMGKSIARVAAATFISLGLLVLLGRFLRRGRLASGLGQGSAIRVLQQCPLGLKSRLLLVDVAGELLLLASQGNQISLLTKISQERALAIAGADREIGRQDQTRPQAQVDKPEAIETVLSKLKGGVFQGSREGNRLRQSMGKLRNLFKSQWRRMAEDLDSNSFQDQLMKQADAVQDMMGNSAQARAQAQRQPAPELIRERPEELISSIRDKVQHLKRLA